MVQTAGMKTKWPNVDCGNKFNCILVVCRRSELPDTPPCLGHEDNEVLPFVVLTQEYSRIKDSNAVVIVTGIHS